MVSVMLYPCMFCAALSMGLFVLCVACLTVFVNCLVLDDLPHSEKDLTRKECATLAQLRSGYGRLLEEQNKEGR